MAIIWDEKKVTWDQPVRTPSDATPEMARAKWGAENPYMNVAREGVENVGKNLAGAAEHTYRNAYGPAANYANARTFGLLGTLAGAGGKNVKDAIFPEPTTGEGKFLNAAGQVVGYGQAAAPIIKGISQIGGKVLTNMAEKKVAQNANKVESGYKAIIEKKKELGKPIEDWHYKGPGNTKYAETDDVAAAIREIPASKAEEILKTSARIVGPDGKPIYRVRDIYDMRQGLGKHIKDIDYSQPGANALRASYKDAERNLQEVIMKQGDDSLKNANKAYEGFSKNSSKLLKALIDKETGQISSTKVVKLLNEKDPSQMARLNALKKEVPEVADLLKVAKKQGNTTLKKLDEAAGQAGKVGLAWQFLKGLGP